MRPPPCSRMCSTAHQHRLAGPTRLTARVRCQAVCHLANETSSMGWASKIPALFTRISSPPRLVMTSVTMRCAVEASARSPAQSTWPVPSRLARVSRAASWLARQCTATCAPAEANWRATARPIPREAPVTNTFLLSKRIGTDYRIWPFARSGIARAVAIRRGGLPRCCCSWRYFPGPRRMERRIRMCLQEERYE